VGLVAEARHITPEAAAAAAEGRVWTGRQAWSRGLVDELGGFEEALEAVRRALGIPEGEPLAIERFPRPTPLWRFPFDFLRPESRALDFFGLLPHLRFVTKERVWAILPYHLRFF
jgi:ClpP class serine protease